MKTSSLIGIACLCTVGTILGAPQAKKVQQVSATPSRSIEGADLFVEYCAVCHGKDARGGGPAAEALKKAPADLTQISRRNGGQFPKIKVQQFVKGENVVTAHGSRDMPTWGTVFRSFEPMQSGALGELRVVNLVNYLEQIQAK
jgi:mono/diheme cytochrome c family protein